VVTVSDCILHSFLVSQSTSFRRLSDVGVSNASLDQQLLLKEIPIQVYQGHEGPITDLAWSKHNFLASSSVDRTVRIWHVRESFCLCIFKHPSGVSGLRFHPKDDRILLTGCADSRLRLWSLAEKKVLSWNELPVICPITCLSFDREANLVCVGTANGDCLFYEYDGLKYNTQINVMSTSKMKKPFKVTGIDMIPSRTPGDDKFLVTAADSRIRMYHLHDKSLICKFKGHEHRSSSFQASASDDGKYILCPSEDRGIYLWKTDMNYTQYSQGVLGSLIQRDTQKVSGFEKFTLSETPVTCALFPPRRVKYQYTNQNSAISNEKMYFGSTMSLNLNTNSLENVLIVCADALGSIHIFINKTDVDSEKQLTQSKASAMNGLFKNLRTRMASVDMSV
jgi:WD40 repeat protein